MRGKQFAIGCLLALALFALQAKAHAAPAAAITVGVSDCKTSVIVCYGVAATIAGTPVTSMALYESRIIFYDANHNVVQSAAPSRAR